MILTVEEIEDLRLRVAQKLGWRNLQYNRDGMMIGSPPGRNDTKTVPAFVTNVRDAWDILNFLTSLGIRFKVSNEAFKGSFATYRVCLGKEDTLLAQATYPLFSCAACMAFLALPMRERISVSGDYKASAKDRKKVRVR